MASKQDMFLIKPLFILLFVVALDYWIILSFIHLGTHGTLNKKKICIFDMLIFKMFFQLCLQMASNILRHIRHKQEKHVGEANLGDRSHQIICNIVKICGQNLKKNKQEGKWVNNWFLDLIIQKQKHWWCLNLWEGRRPSKKYKLDWILDCHQK